MDERDSEARNPQSETRPLASVENSQIVNDLLQAAASSLDLTEVIDSIGEALGRLFAFDRLSLAVHRPEEDVLVSYAWTADSPGGQMRVPVRESSANDAILGGRPVLHADLGQSPYPEERTFPDRFGLRSAMIVPLVSRERAIGTLNISSRELGAYSEQDLLLATEIAGYLGIAVEHALLYEQSKEHERLEERARLAREIHDSLAQRLTSTLMQVEELRDRLGKRLDAGPVLGQLEDSLRQSLDDVRRSVWDLQPLSLEAGGLVEAIRQEVSAAGQQGLRAVMDLDGEKPETMDRRCELTVLRIAQEALANIQKHAEAKRASVDLDFELSKVTLVVSDDGRGFDPARTSEGDFGLASMQERARLVGGRLAIKSAPGLGTRLEAQIPYQPAADVSRSPLEASGVARAASSESISVLVCDGHELIRQGIRRMLEQTDAIEVVGEAVDGEAALEQVQELTPDVLLMDIQMPGLDGVGVLHRLSELGALPATILLSVYARDERIFEGLQAGARGYLVKDVEIDELARAVRTVYEGGSLLPPVVTSELLERLDPKARDLLTPRETEVLQELATGARNKEIARRLYLSSGTVKFHIANIYRKLGASTRTEAVAIARERGLLES